MLAQSGVLVVTGVRDKTYPLQDLNLGWGHQTGCREETIQVHSIWGPPKQGDPFQYSCLENPTHGGAW